MSLLKRWQARKEEVAREKAEQAEQQAEPLATAEPLPEQDAVVAETDAEPEAAGQNAEAEPLPDPDSIEEGGSFAAFMKDDVDPLKRKEALRSLWKQPQFNVRDGLCEYDLDYAKQPKLTADVAAELVKNVFRHASEAEEEQTEQALAEQGDNERLGAEQAGSETPQRDAGEKESTPDETVQLAKESTGRPGARAVLGQNDPSLDPDPQQGQSQA